MRKWRQRVIIIADCIGYKRVANLVMFFNNMEYITLLLIIRLHTPIPKCDCCGKCSITAMDCNVNCVNVVEENVGSGSSTSHTTATDLTNPEVLEDCYDKVIFGGVY